MMLEAIRMGQVRCICGSVLYDGDIPCPFEYDMLSNDSIDDVVADIGTILKQTSADRVMDAQLRILAASTVVYKCPACGRLLVFWDGLEKPFVSYLPEAE